MRVLFSSLPATGHVNSLLPLAEAVADADHEVAICRTPAFADHVAKAGFEHLTGGAETFAQLFGDAPPRSDPDRWRWAHRVAFATRLRGVLAVPAYRTAARTFAADMASLPDLDHAVRLLERLARDRDPILRVDG